MKKILLIIAYAFIGCNTFAQAPSDGLIGYFNFENNYTNHDATHSFTNLSSGLQSIPFLAGHYGNGISFTGTSQLLTNPTIDAFLAGPDFTVAFWQKTTTSPENYATSYELFGSQYFRAFAPNGYNYYGININASTNVEKDANITSTTIGTWVHYTIMSITDTATNFRYLRCYVNGVLYSQYNLGLAYGFHKFSSNVTIGGGISNGNLQTVKRFSGIIDEFYIYNRSLTDTEITAVMNNSTGSIVSSTPQPPTISSNINFTITSPTSATINYALNANGNGTTSVVNYGTSSTNLSLQATGGNASGGIMTNTTATLTGLTTGTTYYYQIVATNDLGSTSSAIMNLTPSDLSVIAEYNFNNTYNNINGSVPFGSVGTLTSFENDRNGASQSALRINATTSAAVIPNLPVGNAARSVSIWVKKPFAATDAHVFRYGPLAVGSNNLVYGLSIQSNNLVNFGYGNDLVATGYGTTGQTWIHVVTTFDGTTARIYHNGIERASGNKSGWNTQNTNFFLGGNNDISVDDLKIYNRVLTPTEITNLYTNNSLLSTGDFNSNDLKASIYPNPTNENFTIVMDSELKSVELYSLQGQKVITSTAKNVNVSNLSKGMYLVRIEDENNAVSTQKLIVK